MHLPVKPPGASWLRAAGAVTRLGARASGLFNTIEVFLKELQRGAIDRDRRMWLLGGGPAS
jgi:hypothetical protein